MNVIIAANFLRSPKKLAFDQPKVAATAIGGIALVLGLAFSAGFLARGADGAAKAEIARLQAEFDRLRDYLELMAVRMGPRLRYRLDLPEALASQPVPPLLLQPLVENCIRHGLEPSREGGEVRVMARRGAGVQDLELEVSDTGVGCAPSPTPGFGLTQVRERLATAYPGRAALDWQASPGGGTRALLTLPLHTPATTP